MAFHLTVKGGPDDGQSFKVEGQCIVGRAPRCNVQLSDAKVAWEQVALQEHNGRLFLQNLSASGTRYQGRPVTGEVRVVNGDEVELSGATRIVIEEKIGAKRSSFELSPPILGGILLVLVVMGLIAVKTLRPVPQTVPPVNLSHWRVAHARLVDRMVEWERRGEFPAEAVSFFSDAWRLELAYNTRAAMEHWDLLASVILTVPLPGDSLQRLTIAEAAGHNRRALEVLMDWAPDTSMSMDPYWRTDEAYADALTWFIRNRAEKTREQIEGSR